MSLSDANRERTNRTKDMEENIKNDIIECYPVSCEGSNIILLNDKMYFKDRTFYSFNELFESLSTRECKYNPVTYTITHEDD